MAKNRRRKKNASSNGKATNFWSANVDGDVLDGLAGSVRPSDKPTSLVRSLGQPPLPGQNLAAGHYFDAVYLKAGHFASALATANDLIDTGLEDSGLEDTGLEDSGLEDSGLEDTGLEDSGDTGRGDSGARRAGGS